MSSILAIAPDVWVARCERLVVLQFEPLNSAIAKIAVTDCAAMHADPADRIIVKKILTELECAPSRLGMTFFLDGGLTCRRQYIVINNPDDKVKAYSKSHF